jgi:transcriptional regulator with XRE-family HTH domain
MEVLAGRMHFKQPASVKDLERNERLGTITLQTLQRAAEALDADLVYAIVPRKPLRETVASRARELAVQRLVPSFWLKAPAHQGLSDEQNVRVEGLARTLERKPHLLWR